MSPTTPETCASQSIASSVTMVKKPGNSALIARMVEMLRKKFDTCKDHKSHPRGMEAKEISKKGKLDHSDVLKVLAAHRDIFMQISPVHYSLEEFRGDVRLKASKGFPLPPSKSPSVPNPSTSSPTKVVLVAPPNTMNQSKPTTPIVPVASSADCQKPTENDLVPAIRATALTLGEVTQPTKEMETAQERNIKALLFPTGSSKEKQSADATKTLGLGVDCFKNCKCDYGLIAQVIEEEGSASISPEVFINTTEPFCLASIGVQGEGKSHTLNTILESCLLDHKVLSHCPEVKEDIINLSYGLATVVFHYDLGETSVCESVGLIHARYGAHLKCSLPREKMVVLVSPTYYKQRKRFYGDHCEVKPLLLDWKMLTGDHIRRLLNLKSSDNQLYVASLLAKLQHYQREDHIPSFQTFVKEVRDSIVGMQQTSFDQRIQLLERFIAQSEENKSIVADGGFFSNECQAGKLVVVDLTDPLLAKSDVNCLFQVLVQQFAGLHMASGKLLVLDEAHRYMDGQANDELSDEIVNLARMMRHNAMRLAISSQSPMALAPELLELVSAMVIHRFHSQDWFGYLRSKLSFGAEQMAKIKELKPGQALLFASRGFAGGSESNSAADTEQVMRVQIRGRLTSDYGASRTHRSANPSV